MSYYYSEKYVLLDPSREDVFKVCSEQGIFGAKEFEERARKLQEKDRILGRFGYIVMLNLTKVFGFRQT